MPVRPVGPRVGLDAVEENAATLHEISFLWLHFHPLLGLERAEDVQAAMVGRLEGSDDVVIAGARGEAVVDGGAAPLAVRRQEVRLQIPVLDRSRSRGLGTGGSAACTDPVLASIFAVMHGTEFFLGNVALPVGGIVPQIRVACVVAAAAE